MKTMDEFFGPNAGYVAELYERYLQDPFSVDPASRAYFEAMEQNSETPQAAPPTVQPAAGVDIGSVISATQCADAIRTFGHLDAHLDPLGSPPQGDPTTRAETYCLDEQNLATLPASVVGGPAAEGARNALEAIAKLRAIYSGDLGFEYGHIRVAEERDWLRDAAECKRFAPPQEPVDGTALLERLTQVEVFEQFIHRHFPGKTRFSIEGVDMLVPALDEIVGCAVDSGVCMIMLGMAHRGRLNVLAHILDKSYAQILAEFKDPRNRFAGLDQLGWTGDVKYHKGAKHTVKKGEAVRLVIVMAPNPSHLEHINPVIEGMARSADSKTDQPGAPVIFSNAAMPVLVHGDAAFPGEGITSETLNFSHLPGYETGGTIHIITNNQLGYTATPHEGRSTLYASDLAKGFEIPIIHVNADRALAVIEAARTAFAYRDKFHKDFMVDLIGYRRFGHNEGDEPSFTQPILYQAIEQHPTARKIWADALIERGEINPDLPGELIQRWMNRLQQVLDTLQPEVEIVTPPLEAAGQIDFKPQDTAIPFSRLQELNQQLLDFPEGFAINRKLERPIQRRRKAFDDPYARSIEWATAEELAMATILADGTPIRLTGQDTERGTFSQRHAVFHDVNNGQAFIPLQTFPAARAAFDIHNSPLSENGALGFEFGYSVLAPNRMDIWEAQYGDFVNAAQPMIDEFISSAKAKWEENNSLVILLPHGYEGQGPDHSSGRPERWLQLSAPNAMRVANCTTPAQYFHLLRQQALLLVEYPLPLVIFTPKSLLRHPLVVSSPQELAEGHWQPVIGDESMADAKSVRRLAFCTGKIAIDLVEQESQKHPEVAIVRVEQLAPFPLEAVEAAIDGYPNIEQIAWVQEEPENMGAWPYIQPYLQKIAQNRWPVLYMGRGPSSSPAEGSTAWHMANQAALLEQVLNLAEKETQGNIAIKKG